MPLHFSFRTYEATKLKREEDGTWINTGEGFPGDSANMRSRHLLFRYPPNQERQDFSGEVPDFNAMKNVLIDRLAEGHYKGQPEDFDADAFAVLSWKRIEDPNSRFDYRVSADFFKKVEGLSFS